MPRGPQERSQIGADGLRRTTDAESWTACAFTAPIIDAGGIFEHKPGRRPAIGVPIASFELSSASARRVVVNFHSFWLPRLMVLSQATLPRNQDVLLRNFDKA